jgi:hypothetical protein
MTVGRVPGGCGLLTLYSYLDGNYNASTAYGHYDEKFTEKSLSDKYPNAGFLVMCYIENNVISKKTYDMMEKKKEFTKVYQSPVRKNKNSSNMFFFCIYDLNPPQPKV